MMNIEQYLAENGRLIYTNKGRSMLPLLREGRDLFIIEAKRGGRCNVGDAVLFKRGSDYVLHRVIAVHSGSYDILGDNCINPERGIKEADILGIMTGFVRDGREHSINEPCYRLYVYVWLRTAGLRIFLKKVINRVRKICR